MITYVLLLLHPVWVSTAEDQAASLTPYPVGRTVCHQLAHYALDGILDHTVPFDIYLARSMIHRFVAIIIDDPIVSPAPAFSREPATSVALDVPVLSAALSTV